MEKFIGYQQLSVKQKGFTLVELLVVMVVITVLIGISISVFSNVQSSARDAERKAEIDSIAKSLEATKNYSTGLYSNGLLNDFPDGIPIDPDGPTKKYCIKTLDSLGTNIDNPASWSEGCNSGWYDVVATLDLSTAKKWKVCASLESSDTVFCRESTAR